VNGDKMNSLFDGLNFREKSKNEREGKKLVKDVLKGIVNEFSDKVLALLFIVYRIRNNIFHGVKSFDKWDEQAENILKSSRVLSFTIEEAITRGAVTY
jgi:exonuclease I